MSCNCLSTRLYSVRVRSVSEATFFMMEAQPLIEFLPLTVVVVSLTASLLAWESDLATMPKLFAVCLALSLMSESFDSASLKLDGSSLSALFTLLSCPWTWFAEEFILRNADVRSLVSAPIFSVKPLNASPIPTPLHVFEQLQVFDRGIAGFHGVGAVHVLVLV